MDWNDNKSDAEKDKDLEEEVEENVEEEEESTQQEDDREQHVPRRQHTQSSWMQDYVTGEDLSNDDFKSHLTLNNDSDHVHYE